jgi:hypothetical protein
MIEIQNRKEFDVEVVNEKIFLYTSTIDAEKNIVWHANEISIEGAKQLLNMLSDVVNNKKKTIQVSDIVLPTTNMKVVLSLKMLGDKFMQIATIKANEIISADNMDGMKIMIALQESKDFESWCIKYNEYFGEYVKVVS